VFEHVTETTLMRRRERDQGVMSLFGDWGSAAESDEPGFDERLPVPDVEFDKTEKLRFEKEMLGLYVSDHPLFGVEAALRRKVDHGIADVLEPSNVDDGAMVHVGGVVTGLTRKFTRRGDQMAVFVLEDLGAAIEVTLFPRTLAEQGHKLVDDVIVAVKGRLDRRDESRIGLICQSVDVLTGLGAGAPPLCVRIASTSLDELCIQRLKRILREHPGDSVVTVDLGGGRSLRLPDDYRVDVDRVVGELRIAFGHDSVAL
jgi:DNA polymerase-3 subunit alpha